jgi:uridine phosphorylase
MPEIYPILEFDPAAEAIIEPRRVIKPIDAPEHGVFCFFQEVITRLVNEGQATPIATQRSEMGPHPVYQVMAAGRRVALCHPGVGAALAAGMLEEVIALGCRKFIACGGAGVLNREIAVGHLVVPTSAVRDEGTSYHYLPPSREVAADPTAVAAIERTLQAHGVPYLLGKTWTTDGLYRETAGRVQRRKAEGCLTVEMEAAAFFAVAQFRGVPFGQMLYGGDDVSGSEWDQRGEWDASGWHGRRSVRERLFWLAAEACLAL